MRPDSLLRLAALSALAMTAIALVAIVRGPSVAPATLEDLVPVLVAGAGLCVAGLTHRRAPSIAWLAIIGALTIATLDIAAWGRSNQATFEPLAWPWLVALVCVGAIFTTASAAAYASEPGRRLGGWVRWLAAIAVGITGLVCVWIFGTLEAAIPLATRPTAGDLGAVNRALLATVTGLTVVGILGDLRPAATRTRLRLDDLHGTGEARPGRTGVAIDGARIFIEEITPGRGHARHAVDTERSRIAAELHADVVPLVRQALREAEDGGSPERLAVALRDVLTEVDGLVADRQSITLEAFGLLAAIEWLAERTEDRSDVRVWIDVTDVPGQGGDDGPDAQRRPPRPVESAAFRVAQLALENVVRHAPNASARVELTAAPRFVRLVVSDDGPGMAADAGPVAAASGRRGLADMRAAAIGCGASLLTGVAPGGRGAIVRFAWPPD